MKGGAIRRKLLIGGGSGNLRPYLFGHFCEGICRPWRKRRPMKKWIKIGAVLLCAPLLIVGAGLSYLLLAFPKVAAAQSITLPRDPARIEHGRYLAEHLAMCIECHSLRDWSRYAGPLQDSHLGAGREHAVGLLLWHEWRRSWGHVRLSQDRDSGSQQSKPW